MEKRRNYYRQTLMNNQLIALNERYHNRREKYTQAVGRQNQILESIEKIENEMKAYYNLLEKLDKVDSLFKITSDYARSQSKEQIESIVSNCLNLIFERPLEFKIELKELRNKSSAEFYILEEDQEEPFSIIDSKGGGIVDIISLSLRIAFLLKFRPNIEGPLILDEPAKHVSSEFIYNVADFLRKISIEFNRQIILISHDEHLSSMADQAYRIKRIDNHSEVEKLDFSDDINEQGIDGSLDISRE